MANIDQAEAKRLLDASLGVAAFTAPTTPMKLALSTAATSSTSAGTEVTGGSYARQTITPRAASNSGSVGGTTNNGIISFTNMPAVTVTDANIYDNAGTPRRCWYGQLSTARTTSAGDTLSFADSAVSITLG
jgi:hypothetical protein